MSDGDAYWSVLESALDGVSIYDGPERFLKQFGAAEVVPRNLFAAHYCQSEICNGGFRQFFENSTGVLAPEAVDAFRLLGMPEISILISNAMAWFGSTYPRERDARMDALSECATSPFDNQDTAFYRLLDSENGGFYHAADKYALSAQG